ncbi:magnesium transporter [Nitrosomonas communis]|uniref:magnesium transporter n=1 Tax=Nitrosomonas communis TaxID=44574 RepID=UPI003D267B09
MNKRKTESTRHKLSIFRQHFETAGRYLVASVPRALPTETVATVCTNLSKQVYENIELICVTEPTGKLVGVISVSELFAAAPNAHLEDVMHKNPPYVYPEVDQERVASIALHHRHNAVAVVDHHHFLLGTVPSDALMHILRREHVEDLHRLVGIGRESDVAREALELPPLRRVRHRLPWLIIGLLGSMMSALLVSSFEAELTRNVAIAFFVPGLVYIADAIGTQSEAVAVRGLSLSQANLRHLVRGESRTGMIIGAILGLLIFPFVWIFFADFNLAIAVSLSLIIASSIASTIGMVLPWLLQRLGTDPAYGSGPLATIIQDILSLLVYFLIVSMFVF